jgi:hypothetical protein
MIWEQPQSFKSVCRWSTRVDMEKRRGRSALCTRSALHHAGEPSRFRPYGGATPSVLWRVMPHPPFAERDGLGNKARQGETPTRHSRSTLATVARPPMPIVASSYRAASPTSSTLRSHPPPLSARISAGPSALKPHHALHASPGMADACRSGRECPWCAESPALTGPGGLCQDAWHPVNQDKARSQFFPKGTSDDHDKGDSATHGVVRGADRARSGVQPLV